MIEFKNIHLSFENKNIFKDFSLKINAGEKILIHGKSGIGKSSLFNMLLGFIQPQQGEILFNDIPVCNQSIWDLRKQTAYIDQENNYIGEKVSDWFDFILKLKANRKVNFDIETIKEKFSFFDLDFKIYNAFLNDISGGEKQRISIIISLLLSRKVYLLDEITSSLDNALKHKTANYFLENPDYTVITVSHDPVWKEHDKIKIFDLEKNQWI